MAIEELATIVMGELSFINMWLMILSVICIITIIIVVYKLNKQARIIDDMSYEIDMLRLR